MSSRQLDEEAIFQVARLIAEPEGRATYLDQVCSGDQHLRERVEALLQVHEQEQEFLKSDVAPTEPPAPITESPGQQIGRYKLREQIGEGGMGVVFVAEQERPIQRKVALKIIKPGMDTKEVIARFEAERQALALMNHPNIAKVLDAGTTETGRPYFVMELVQGIPITDYCDRYKLTTKQRLELFVTVCQAVQHAHQKGVIHRDLKPSNVMITEHDGKPVVKVIDFGVAKAISRRLTEQTIYTRFQQMVGTPMYMSPEQAELSGLDVDTRSDVYSLGVLLYEVLTGTTPFDKQRFSEAAYDEIRRIIREEEPPKPSTKISSLGATASEISVHRQTDPRRLSQALRGELDWIVMKAIDKDRGRRYETANGFATDIQRYLDDEPVRACPPSAGYRLRKFVRRNKAAVSTMIIVAASVLSGLVGMTWLATIARSQRNEARIERDRAVKAERTTARERDRAVNAETLARKETARATVMRLAAQSRSVGEELPVQSVLLAIEAVLLSQQSAPSSIPVAQQTVLNAVSGLGGRPFVAQGRIEQKALAISPDGRWLATGGGNSARLWDLDASDPLQSPYILDGTADAVTFSANSRWLIAAGNGTVRLMDLRVRNPLTGSVTLMRDESAGFCVGLSISNDGRRLVTAWKDPVQANDSIRTWDLAAQDPRSSGRVVGDVDIHVRSRVAISPDGRSAVTLSASKPTGYIVDLMADDPISSAVVLKSPGDFALRPFDGRPVISPDGRWLATQGTGYATLLWELPPGPMAVPRVLAGHESWVHTHAFSLDGRSLATVSWDKTVRLWDLTAANVANTGMTLTGHDGPVVAAEFSPNGRWLVTGSIDKTARVWDLSEGDPNESSRVLRSHEAAVRAVRISSDGCRIVTGSFDNMARMWDLGQGGAVTSPHLLQGHSGALAAVAVSGDSQRLVTGSEDGTVRVWDMSLEEPASSSARVLRTSPGLRDVAISRSGNWLAAGGGNGNVHLWNLTVGDSGDASVVLSGHEDRVDRVIFSPDEEWLISGSLDGTVRLWNLASNSSNRSTLVLHGDGSPVGLMSLSRDGRLLATASRWDPQKDTIRIFDLHSDNPPDTLRIIKLSKAGIFLRREGILSLVISPDSRWLVSASDTMHLWPLNDSDPIPRFLGQTGAVLETAFSPDGRWLAAGNWNGSVRLWNTQTAEGAFVELPKHQADVAELVFSPDSRWLATASGDATARLWDCNAADLSTSYRVLRGHKGGVNCLAFSPNGRWLITGSQDHTARVWDLGIDSVLERARKLAGRELTTAERKQYSLDSL